MREIPVGTILEYEHGEYRVIDRRKTEIFPADDSTDYLVEALSSETVQTGTREWLHETDVSTDELEIREDEPRVGDTEAEQ